MTKVMSSTVSFGQTLEKHLSEKPLIEILAVVFNLSYTVLYIAGLKVCFVFALVGSLLFVALCYNRKIFAEVALQGFYVATAIYGWMMWGQSTTGGNWEANTQWMLILGGMTTWGISGWLLRKFTDAKLPYLDTFTTVFSILATWLMVNLQVSNWWYWLVIDAVSIILYYKRGMKFGALMFVVYWLLTLVGIYEAFFQA